MATCTSCGGVLGRDCFNPDECAWIAEQQQADSYRLAEQVHYQENILQQMTVDLQEARRIAENMRDYIRENSPWTGSYTMPWETPEPTT